MTRKDRPGRQPQPTLVECRRTGRRFDLAEHERCPYCYGTREEIASGEHSTFCDFDPERDPIHFGFPEDNPRYTHG